MSRAYRLNGLRLDSDFDLPALPGWDGPAAAPSDVVFRHGKVPSRLDRPDHVAPVFQTGGSTAYLLALAGTGRIIVRDGREVTVEPEAAADATVTSAILAGPIQSVLWHQRGLLPLHASAIDVEGRTVALCGHAATGKSTLAAVLAAQGHAVMADDICPVDARGGAEVSVLPGCGRLRLWRDALDRIGTGTNGLTPALSGKETYFLDCGDRIAGAPRKLAAVVLLSRQQDGAVTLERLRGARAAGALHGIVHMRRPARALGRAPHIFAALTRVASSGATVWRLKVSSGPACLREAAAKVLTALEA
jgi:hypothetical protein